VFVAEQDIQIFTGKRRPSAQARCLHRLGIRHTRRLDGTIALRQEELDRHTLTKPPEVKRWRSLDLSLLRGVAVA
jgi:Domain of unknown function (DUF4224)